VRISRRGRFADLEHRGRSLCRGLRRRLCAARHRDPTPLICGFYDFTRPFCPAACGRSVVWGGMHRGECLSLSQQANVSLSQQVDVSLSPPAGGCLSVSPHAPPAPASLCRSSPTTQCSRSWRRRDERHRGGRLYTPESAPRHAAARHRGTDPTPLMEAPADNRDLHQSRPSLELRRHAPASLRRSSPRPHAAHGGAGRVEATTTSHRPPACSRFKGRPCTGQRILDQCMDVHALVKYSPGVGANRLLPFEGPSMYWSTAASATRRLVHVLVKHPSRDAPRTQGGRLSRRHAHPPTPSSRPSRPADV
jgi:hypothetical protein